MANDLKARDKAQAGLWLIRQAVLQLLQENKGGLQPHQIREELGLKSDESSAPGIALSITKLMLDAGEIEKDGNYHPVYTAKGSTH